MSLNIKNERVHDLARRAAGLAGKSQTAVIEEALERYLTELAGVEAEAEAERRRRMDIVFAEIKRTKVTDADRARGREILDGLYDPESGLPA